MESPLSKQDAQSIQKRSWALGRSGASVLYLGRERVGDVTGFTVWPHPHQAVVKSGNLTKAATLNFPEGTADCELCLNERGWKLHKADKLVLDNLTLQVAGRSRSPLNTIRGVAKNDSDPRPSIYADDSTLEPVPFTPEAGFEEAEPTQEAVDVDSDESLRPWYSRYGPGLKRLPAADAARHAVNPQHHPAVRRAMARRARHGH